MGEIMPLHPPVKNQAETHLALAPEFQSPAVARCCKAWNRAFKAHTDAGTSSVWVPVRANEAYRSAMPPLTTPQNLCDFVACVAHGVAVRTILPAHATSLLDAARVAARAFKFVEGTSALRSAKRKNKIPGCETVDWDFVAVKTTTYPELASQICPKMTQNQRDLSHVLYENVTGLTPHRMLSIRISLRTRMKKHGKRGFPIHPSFLPLAPCG